MQTRLRSDDVLRAELAGNVSSHRTERDHHCRCDPCTDITTLIALRLRQETADYWRDHIVTSMEGQKRSRKVFRYGTERAHSAAMNVLITGTSSGIGRALASRMVCSGHVVWGVARRENVNRAMRAELGDRFRFSTVDVTDGTEVRKMITELHVSGFVPDAVVLNAGIYPHDCDEYFDDSVADFVLKTNLSGALGLVGQMLQQFLQAGAGQFLAVSSVLAVRPDPFGVGYASSKAALTMAFRSLALRYADTAVQFKTILLGPVATAEYSGGTPGKASLKLHLCTADQAAAAIERTLLNHCTTVYYPRLVGMAFRVTSWLPDSAFHILSRPFRR